MLLQMETHESPASPLLSSEFRISKADEAKLLQRLADRRSDRKNIRSVALSLVVVLVGVIISALFAGPRHPQLHTPGLRKRATDCVQPNNGAAGAQVVITSSSSQARTSLVTISNAEVEGEAAVTRVVTSEWVEQVPYLITITKSQPPAPVQPAAVSQPPPQPAPNPQLTSSAPPRVASSSPAEASKPAIHKPGEAFATTPCPDSPADATVACCGEARCIAVDPPGQLWPNGCTVNQETKTACVYVCQATGFTLVDATSCKPTASPSSSGASASGATITPQVFQGPAVTIACTSEAPCAEMSGMKALQASCSNSACAYECGENACPSTSGENMLLGACMPTKTGAVPSEKATATCSYCSTQSAFKDGQCTATAPARRLRYMW